MLIIQYSIYFLHVMEEGAPRFCFFVDMAKVWLNITFHVQFCIAYNLWIISLTPARIIPSHDPPKPVWESRQKHFRVTTRDKSMANIPFEIQIKTNFSKNCFGALGDYDHILGEFF